MASQELIEILEDALGSEVKALLQDEAISEIRVNADGALWADKLGHGKFTTGFRVTSEKAERAIKAVAFSINEVCNDLNPAISAELPGSGERFQGVLPPLSEAPIIVIRKKAIKVFSLAELELSGCLPTGGKDVLTKALLAKQNILVVGSTDSGKTTFANALLKSIEDTKDRIIIMEDTRELQCNGHDVVYLRTKDGTATLQSLVKIAMRLSPIRIVIGEVRGAEALDLIKAWNTGHGGGVCTVHASSARQGLSRIEHLIQEANVPPSKNLISEAINLVVYMEKVGTKRIIKEISRVVGVENNKYVLDPLLKGNI